MIMNDELWMMDHAEACAAWYRSAYVDCVWEDRCLWLCICVHTFVRALEVCTSFCTCNPNSNAYLQLQRQLFISPLTIYRHNIHARNSRKHIQWPLHSR